MPRWISFGFDGARRAVPSRLPHVKAIVGLEVRFDKMHAYITDTAAAHRMPRSTSSGPTWMATTASRSSTCRSDRKGTPISLRRHAWSLLKQPPHATRGMGSAITPLSESGGLHGGGPTATVLTRVKLVLGVFFDPSTYGTDTNAVVIDFLAVLLHDTEGRAAALSADLAARARARLHLHTRLKGVNIPHMTAIVRDAAFIGSMNNLLA
eukprot:jgi/Tetstr1/459362/TSEL_000430.t1